MKRIRQILWATLGATIIVSGIWLVGKPATIGAANPHPPLGINLSGVVDWSTEIVFVDAFQAARPWISQASGKPFGQGGPLELDEHGNVKSLRDGQFAEALMYVDIGAHYPGGKYLLSYDGSGTVEIGGSGTITKEGNPKEVTVTPNKGLLSLKLTKTDPKNPVRNIRLVMSEHANARTPFYPPFVKRYAGFQAIRFMDWQRTNNSKQVKWADRATPQTATQTTDKGVCMEHMLQLANTLEVDPWFCLPHMANDDYVRQFAKLVKEQLKLGRKVYIEYSNETWNGQFEQAKYCQAKGQEFNLSKNAYEAQLRYSAQRSLEIFKLFEEVFGGKDRLVRVLATQGANPWTGTTVMDWKDAYKNADAIAIAPYFGNAYGDPKTADQTAALTVAQLLEGCQTSVMKNKETNATYAREATKRKLQLLAYESGQHLAGYGGAENNDKLTTLFQEANRQTKMHDVYLQDLRNWKEIGGGLNCVFSSVGRYSKWGSWGLLEYGDQDEQTAPKLRAVRAFIAEGAKK